MKRFFCVLTVTCACTAASVGAALAGGGSSGKGQQTLTATCSVSGAVTVHASGGASAWVSNTHYVLVRFMGTVTPTTGTPFSFTKVYGHKSGFKPASVQTCTGSQTSSMGTLTFTAWVAPTPAH